MKKTCYYLVVVISIVISGCSLFSYENHRARKVADYFASIESLSFQDEWHGTIGAGLPIIDAKSKPQALQTMAHTVQCDQQGCFDTFTGQDKTLAFASTDFAKGFNDSFTKYQAKEKQSTCGIEMLAFDKKVKTADFVRVLKSLRDFQCFVVLIAQRPKPLLAWPQLSKKDQASLDSIIKLSGKEQKVAAKKWFATFGKSCKVVSDYRKNTESSPLNERRKQLATLLGDNKTLDELDLCKRFSDKLIIELRSHAMGFNAGVQDLFTKKISFAPTPKQADIVISPKIASWNDFIQVAFHSSKAEPAIAL